MLRLGDDADHRGCPWNNYLVEKIRSTFTKKKPHMPDMSEADMSEALCNLRNAEAERDEVEQKTLRQLLEPPPEQGAGEQYVGMVDKVKRLATAHICGPLIAHVPDLDEMEFPGACNACGGSHCYCLRCNRSYCIICEETGCDP